ncbi:uncharacterized protein LOC115094414 isoform X1 [Rhinatrema bivittatum]|uniref:uncharacterized protein LOC115094414 isoform X1 n=1 Tax=Rhinatrema bivittatum TaxID=194408 RepID=UPI001127BB7D|nr:uncharacterized protein LOC115094414 isoform X1 [Rhinatrema bivittatum]
MEPEVMIASQKQEDNSSTMVVSKKTDDTLGFLTISAGRITGSFLLALSFYSSTRAVPLIPSTALGVLLLILAALLAYAGVQKSLGNAPVVVSFCLTVSALWCSSGVIQILQGQGILHGANDMRNAMIPGLLAFSLGMFIIGAVGLLQKEISIAIMAFAISFSNAHGIVMFLDSSFGSSAVACNYLIVTIVSVYLLLGGVLRFLSMQRIILPGTAPPKGIVNGQSQGKGASKNDLVVIGLILNISSASVFGCKLLGVTTALFVGQVPWLLVAGVYQIGICILSYRCLDTLAATFFGFTSILRFAEAYSLLFQMWQAFEPVFPIPILVVFAVLFFILALFFTSKSLVEGLYVLLFVAYCIAISCKPTGIFQCGPQGVDIVIFVASAFLALVYLYNIKAVVKIPTGEGMLKDLLSRTHIFKFSLKKDLNIPFLGYSKYGNAEVLGHACNTLAAFCITTIDPTSPLITVMLPWKVVAGGFLQVLSGSVAFSHGKTLESTAFIFYGIMWIIWGFFRFGSLYGAIRGFNIAVGIICFMIFNCFIVFCTLFLSKVWFIYSLTFELIIISFLLDALNALPFGYDIAVTIIFGLVSFYCFFLALFNSTFESPQLPVGTPFLKVSGFGNGSAVCPHLPCRKATSVKRIAEIMKNGGICGIPTDTMYMLVAAYSRPDAVEKAYRTKVHTQDRPMSLWISSLNQLQSVKHFFSPLLWDFMQAAWPSSISLVIQKGEWMDCLGLKDSAKYIGTSQSIAIRIPDCSIATHLIDLIGPIAVTSVNPSGAEDTTHHNQVYAKLGDKVDGVLCDGPSPENIASTVVDCTKIESGNIGFFRVGGVPIAKVLEILEHVHKKHLAGHVNGGFLEETT